MEFFVPDNGGFIGLTSYSLIAISPMFDFNDHELTL